MLDLSSDKCSRGFLATILKQPNGPARALAAVLLTVLFIIGFSFVVYRIGMFATGQFKTRKYISLAVALASGGGALAILVFSRRW